MDKTNYQISLTQNDRKQEQQLQAILQKPFILYHFILFKGIQYNFLLHFIANHLLISIMSGPTRSQINAAVTGIVLQKLGFQVASQTVIPRILTAINPTGGTAFRDALMAGCNLLIRLHQVLQQTGSADTWNLVQVILTDGDDAGSKTSLVEAVQVMYAIGQLLNVHMLKIILIGVGVSQKAEQEMMLLAKAGGQNAQYYRVGNTDINSIFQKITIKLGLEKRQNIIGVANNRGAAFLVHEQINPFLQIQQQNYAVLFNLDVSGSMAGQKWGSVCQSVSRFAGFLGENDLISAMVFNHEAKLLATMNASDQLFRRPQQVQNTYQVRVVPQQQNYYPPANNYRREQAPLKQKNCYCQIM